ncbi:MAG: tetratricopeptide repeat protein [Prevotellaceae bacterium]|jgi:tetratricopeptide (TPR) repeat protein|nr:tetratricopeptide repeat protein [Prevotellaceae bacterium]
MSKKEQKKQDELANVEHALTSSELFIEKYQKQIFIAVSAVVLVILVILAFRNFYLEPREVKAQNQMYYAQDYFQKDSFQLALNGNGADVMGFKQIVSDFGMTSSSNLAKAYAGICYYHLGDYENAVGYLSKYKLGDEYLSCSVTRLIGDAYVELGKNADALKYFEKAGNMNNDIISPVALKKAGILYESTGEPEKAAKAYLKVKDNYPRSAEARDIDKYLARVKK